MELSVFLLECAKKSGVIGWAANVTDCHIRVVFEVQGDESQLDQFFALPRGR